MIAVIQSLWSPFRDWNAYLAKQGRYDEARFKASEALLGIETKLARKIPFSTIKIQSLWSPFRDWNSEFAAGVKAALRFKASEALLGIETLMAILTAKKKLRFKASEALLGIETSVFAVSKPNWIISMIQSLWSPFRDWN